MSDQIQSSTPVDSNPWATDAATSAAPVATDSATQTLSAAADPRGASMAEGSRAAGSASHEVASQAVQSTATQSTDWLNSAPAAAPEHFSLMDPFHNTGCHWIRGLPKVLIGWCCTSARCSKAFACRLISFSVASNTYCWACQHRWRFWFSH